jgi:hypothetical protein
MKKYILIVIVAFLHSFNLNAQSPFQGTWKWDNNNNRLYVYILSKTLNNGDKVLRVDYKLVSINNNVETEIYSSKINGQFFWAGAFLAEHPTSASGMINDKTHPNTEDGIEGRFSLEIISQTSGLQPQLKWKIRKFSDYIQPATTTNPPDDFNLPTDIVLTKI